MGYVLLAGVPYFFILNNDKLFIGIDFVLKLTGYKNVNFITKYLDSTECIK
jgi:hypothetical protein